MKLKNAFCLMTALCIALLMSACSKSGTYALDISGARIPRDVYAYFLDSVISKPNEYGLSAAMDEETLQGNAAELCKKYVAVNTAAKELGVSMSFDEKSAVSVRVNDLWRLFSAHYETIGVTKQTLNKIESANAAKEALLLYYYDTNGEKSVGEDAIKAYFSSNYVSFISINGYLSKTAQDGSTVLLTDTETAALKSKFEAMKVRIMDGESFDAVSEWFASDLGISAGKPVYKLIKKGDSSYPADFFAKVSQLTPGVPNVITLDKYIFLVMKNELSYDSEDYYTHRTESLKALKGDELEQMISSAAQEYTVDVKTRIVTRVYKDILETNS